MQRPQIGFAQWRPSDEERHLACMPRVTPITPALRALLTEQDGVVSTDQLVRHGFDASTVYRRIKAGRWQRLLPTVILTNSGAPTRRQLLVAGWLWGGPDSAIDGADACVWHGIPEALVRNDNVHVVVPATSSARSTRFVNVRRSYAEVVIGARGFVPYVDVGTALIVAARNRKNLPAAIGLLSRGLQLGKVDNRTLLDARMRLGDKWCRPVDAALLAVGIGVRSPAEADMHRLVSTSGCLPEPLWNQWLDLGDTGPELCVDALWQEAGLVNEVIGKKYHAWGERYDDTNARKERLQAAGLIVCEATPTRIRRQGDVVLANLESTYHHHAGRGLPAVVRLIPPPGWSIAS